MAHEIEKDDNVVLHATPAWHGLGTVVADAPTPAAALELAGLDWQVEQWPMFATNKGFKEVVLKGEVQDRPIKDYQLNLRSDTKTQLGIVGKGYRPIQNSELADFCTALAEQGDMVKIESAGSIRNGRKVWFLLKGESFSVRGKDEVSPYILVSNGHDGGTAMRCTPTTIRVVCSNTLHMVVPEHDGEVWGNHIKSYFVAHHTSTIMERVTEAKAALQLYDKSIESTRSVIDWLAAKDVNSEAVKQFFMECYVRDFGAIPTNPKTRVEENARKRATTGYGKFQYRFQSDLTTTDATAWGALNAYTGYIQHDRPTRVRDKAKAADQGIDSKLFGTNAQRGHAALQLALSI